MIKIHDSLLSKSSEVLKCQMLSIDRGLLVNQFSTVSLKLSCIMIFLFVDLLLLSLIVLFEWVDPVSRTCLLHGGYFLYCLS